MWSTDIGTRQPEFSPLRVSLEFVAKPACCIPRQSVMVSAGEKSVMGGGETCSPVSVVPEINEEAATLSKTVGGPVQSGQLSLSFGDESSVRDAFSREDIVLKIMSFCSWQNRLRIAVLNKSFRDSCSNNDNFWHSMCAQLREESLVYVPEIPATSAWRDLFAHLYKSKDLFQATAAQPDITSEEEIESQAPTPARKEEKFQIQVCARMRPRPPASARKDDDDKQDSPAAEAMTVLPLHQRLQLIRRQHNCSAAEAKKMLWQRTGEEQQDPWAQADVRVAERSKDGSKSNTAEGAPPAEGRRVQAEAVQACVVSVTGGVAGSVLMCVPGSGLRDFGFDAVFNETSSQAHIYDASPRLLVADFLNGHNACIFAYGQTGSGKTFTMFGPDAASGAAVEGTDTRSGIVPRACREVLQAVQWRRRQGVRVTLMVTYVEIFGEAVTDLLNEGAAVGQWQGVAHRAVYAGECAVPVSDEATLKDLLLKGDATKRRAATDMNERSSRAHSLLLFRLLQEKGDAETASTLCLADLGGSEQVLKSGVASLEEAGGGFMVKSDRFVEAININLGLLSLKSCINALRDQLPHVPYGNSRLTMMLTSALGGDCRTCVVVTGSSEPRHALETLNALKFGQDCAQVVNASTDSLGAALKAIRALDAEIEALEAEIVQKERWETVRTTRRDELRQADEATNEIETVVTTRLVGAELERDHLELLLSRRRILTGV